MKIALNRCDFGIFLRSQLIAINAASPYGVPQRLINNPDHKKNTELPRRTLQGARKQGALLPAIFIVTV